MAFRTRVDVFSESLVLKDLSHPVQRGAKPVQIFYFFSSGEIENTVSVRVKRIVSI